MAAAEQVRFDPINADLLPPGKPFLPSLFADLVIGQWNALRSRDIGCPHLFNNVAITNARARGVQRPFPAALMRMWPISTRVNKPENDDPSIVEPVELASDAA